MGWDGMQRESQLIFFVMDSIWTTCYESPTLCIWGRTDEMK